MGWVLFRKGQYERAIEYLRRAFELMPDAEVAAHLGEVLWAAGKTDEARQLWRDARRKDPDNQTLQQTLTRLKVSL
jgi:Flp pilus assembly protein TadD